MKRALVLVDHGSREPAANELIGRVAEAVRGRLPDRDVRGAHMELAEPSLADAIEACVADGAEEVVVQPYFLGPGRHSLRDIPRLAEEATRRHPGLAVRVGEPLGLHDGLVDAVLARVRDCEGG